ncbi:NUDIX hydrolase [Halorubrum lipolyticum DSM 21995]|uniref:NUDIX hydrolase n=1 Tax=Halorubrum lipolyticum DSM 21995 TaxID=1227482 RepID=M0NKW4_9EURY|nr:NUDIX hydrolase [Halorubrum lipolyticum DSM 21995]
MLSGPREDVLVLRRDTDGEWELPGGRMGPSESVSECLRREVREETSLSLEIEDILLANSWSNDRDQDRFAVYYVCETDERAVSLSEEHVESEWVSPSEAAFLLSSPQATAVRLSCDRIDTNPVLDL